MPFRTLPLAHYQRRQHSGVLDSAGRLVLFGDNWDNSLPDPGFSPSFGGYDIAHKYAERYDPATTSWTILAPLITSFENYAWGIDTHDRLYAAAGLVESDVSGFSGAYTTAGDTYDPGANTWSPMGALSSGQRRRLGYFWMNGDDFYVAGGESASFTFQSDALRYSGGSWTSFPNPFASDLESGGFHLEHAQTTYATCTVEKHPRYGALVDTLGRFHVLGVPSVALRPNGQHHRFDPSSGTWTRLSALPVGVPFTLATIVLPDDSMYCFANTAGSRYDPIGDTWSTVSACPLTPNTLLYESGYIYAFCNVGQVLRYSVATDAWADTGDQWIFNFPAFPYALPVGDGAGYYLVYQGESYAGDGTYDEDTGNFGPAGTRRVDYWTPPRQRRAAGFAQVIG